ncbi:Beta-monoglucosyldiacylglycerol synthase [Bacillus subtilis]|nr:Beta-monoglucosyldiacylglycerol synthase [Bacillus subtilis]
MEIIQLFFLFLQIVVILFTTYWIFISFFGFGKPKTLKAYAPHKRFLLLVAAHNEEKVIQPLVQNLLRLDYPKELYDVFVIADNCTDQTAEITRNAGGHVINHTSAPNEPRGKPYGIRYALNQFGSNLVKKYDAVAIFDADNLVSLNYLKEMNNHLCNGEKLIQCYLDSKNPNDNWMTLSYATSYYYMNRSWQLAKYRLGLGNAIGGTGFCVDTTLMREVGWTACSLTEDLEFTIQCLLKGVPATWSHHARIYDEKPNKLSMSMIQRLRWSRGHWDVCFRYAGKLLWKSVRHWDIRLFDGFLYLINPGKVVLGTLVGIIASVDLFTNQPWIHVILPWWLWFSLLGFGFSYILYTIKIDAKNQIHKGKAILSLFLFNYTYIPLFVWSFFTFNKKVWVRTNHSRNIVLDEIDDSQKNIFNS